MSNSQVVQVSSYDDPLATMMLQTDLKRRFNMDMVRKLTYLFTNVIQPIASAAEIVKEAQSTGPIANAALREVVAYDEFKKAPHKGANSRWKRVQQGTGEHFINQHLQHLTRNWLSILLILLAGNMKI